jgi:hypothetical protein
MCRFDYLFAALIVDGAPGATPWPLASPFSLLIAFGRDHGGMHGDPFFLDSLLQDEILTVCSIYRHQVCATEELCRVAQRVYGSRFCEAQGGAVRDLSGLSGLLPVPCQCVSRFPSGHCVILDNAYIPEILARLAFFLRSFLSILWTTRRVGQIVSAFFLVTVLAIDLAV